MQFIASINPDNVRISNKEELQQKILETITDYVTSDCDVEVIMYRNKNI